MQVDDKTTGTAPATKKKLIRLFVAMDIPEDVRRSVAALAAKLHPLCKQARWVRIEDAHLTLKFIGEVLPEQAERIKAALMAVHISAPVEIRFRNVGFFPNERRPHVLWAGIEAGPELSALAAAVESVLEPLGIAREQREFSPHLTMARFSAPENLTALRAAIAAAGNLEFGRCAAGEFHLYQSVLKPGGAEYTRLATFI
jgi:2'-5' RNA ligase